MTDKSLSNRSVSYDVGAWYQSYPYNAQYPRNYNMGCVPVTFAGLMFFHKYPLSGKGCLEATADKPEVNLSTEHYDWDMMIPGPTPNPPEDKVEMTSKFMMHLARASKVNPGSGGIAGTHFDASKALIDNFKYDKNIVNIPLTDDDLCYTPQDIETFAIDELNSGRPFGIGILRHSIVCNGYDLDRRDKFQVYSGGGSNIPVWTDFKNGRYIPLEFTIGVRPEEDEVLTLTDFHSYFEGENIGDTGDVSCKIFVNDTTHRDFKFRVVVYDEAGVRRNIISDEMEISTESEIMTEITIPVEIPQNITFGVRKMVFEYKYGDVSYRPLRNINDEIQGKSLMLRRTVNNNIIIISNSDFPSEVTEGDMYEAHIELDNRTQLPGFIAVALVDGQHNQRFILGKTTISGNSNISLKIPLDFNDVTSEKSYGLCVLYSEQDDFDNATPAFIKLNEDILTKSVYVKNNIYIYHDNIELFAIENIDLSTNLLSSSTYDVNIGLNTEGSNPRTTLWVKYLDMDYNEIAVTQSSYIDGTGEFYMSAPMVTPYFIYEFETKDILICFGVKTYDENSVETFRLLKPANALVENPLQAKLDYQNFYNDLYLTSTPELTTCNLKPGDSFNVSSSAIFTPGFSSIRIFLTDIDILIEDSMGNITSVGSIKMQLFSADVITDFSINCTIPVDVSEGEYSLYLKAHNSISEYSQPNDYIQGYESNVDDHLNIFLTINH